MVTALMLLACYGLCFAFQQKITILHGLSEFTDALLRCTFCIGFHCGWVVWCLASMSGLVTVESLWHMPGTMLLWGFASAASCYLLDAVTNWLETAATSE